MGETAKVEQWHIPVINHLKMADMVTTTTHIFANEIKKHNKNVCILPNAIDINDERFKIETTKSDRLRFGIICSATHLKDLELMEGMTAQLSKETLDKMQFVLCGFDTRGTKQVYNADTKKWETRTFAPEETTWYKYEKIITNNFKIVSEEHKQYLHLFDKEHEFDCSNEPYRRCWTKNTTEYYKHYENIDVLLVPLKVNDFNLVKSQLKVVEAGFAHKAIIANNVGPYTIDLKPMIEKGGKINEEGNALLIEPSKNHKLWSKYITKLVEDRDMLEKLKINLHNTVKDTYSLETVCKDRVNMYLKMMYYI
jgi:glycosyltransferase involved in cell wall biosynthesis